MAIKVAEAEESVELLEFLGCGPFCDARDFDGVHLYLALGDNNTKVLDGKLVEGAFFRFKIEVVFSEAGKDVVSQFMEGREVVVEDEDVVKVDDKVILVDEV